MPKSIFDPTAKDEPIRGGLDSFLGPKASDYSSLPDSIEDGQADAESESADETEVVCDGQGIKPAVCEIKEALDEKLHTQPPKPLKETKDGPG